MGGIGRHSHGLGHTRRMRIRMRRSYFACVLLLTAVPLITCLILFRSIPFGSVSPLMTKVELHCYGPSNASFVVATVVDLVRPALAWVDGYKQETHQLIRANRIAWTSRHGARYCELDGLLDPGRTATWNKIVLMRNLLSCPHHKWLMYLDFDAIFMNYELGPQALLELTEKKSGGSRLAHFIFSSDYQPSSPINAGVFLVRNTNYSAKLLQNLYDPQGYHNSVHHHWNEQHALHTFFTRNHTEFLQHCKIVHYSLFNQHMKQYSSGNFVAHYAGMPARKYEYIRKELLKHSAANFRLHRDDSFLHVEEDSCSKRLNKTRVFAMLSSDMGRIVDAPRSKFSDQCSSHAMLGSTIIQYQ